MAITIYTAPGEAKGWTFRVLVPPGSARTLRGPYRLLRHPNYVAVVGELAGFALLARAPRLGAAQYDRLADTPDTPPPIGAA